MSWTTPAARPRLGPSMMQHEGDDWSWKTLPEPPLAFTSRQTIVVSHALHPDECAIFMTMTYRDTPGEPLGTYSFNIEHSGGAMGIGLYLSLARATSTASWTHVCWPSPGYMATSVPAKSPPVAAPANL